ncbi:hypothetical protein LCGC14_0147070 [marine sediment metagenome]|uniref:Uncharacterized protein n=1 Tax=marine sediment metagenome TaxID=412755 RepID=A0A0F9V047_9ZZZZ
MTKDNGALIESQRTPTEALSQIIPRFVSKKGDTITLDITTRGEDVQYSLFPSGKYFRNIHDTSVQIDTVFGELLGVKPVVTFDKTGYPIPATFDAGDESLDQPAHCFFIDLKGFKSKAIADEQMFVERIFEQLSTRVR